MRDPPMIFLPLSFKFLYNSLVDPAPPSGGANSQKIDWGRYWGKIFDGVWEKKFGGAASTFLRSPYFLTVKAFSENIFFYFTQDMTNARIV